MYLKRLELVGFKSFADRTEMEFVPGVTAVVGPNGSGKSNVSDAIRWVLGEQSARSLRGAKMEDVIFAGSATRKPVNYAEVSLTLDNTDRSLDIEYTEVTVTRRVYRSGESEYYINKRPCRLKDIVELFMDTGVGKEAYSIIGQGKIEEILSTKPEDRRGIFEEAAGIVRYKTRKREAERKLEETEQNLVRIGDIIGEIEEQLGPLGEQAATARTYQELRRQLVEHEVALYVHQIETAHAKWEEAKAQVGRWQEQLAGLLEEIGKREADVEQIRLEVNRLDQSLEELQQALLAVSEEAEKTEGQREVLKERQRNLAANRQQTMEQMHRLTGKQRDVEAQLEEELRRRDEARGRLEEAERDLAAAEAEYDEVLKALADNVDALKSDYFETLNEMAGVRNELRHAEQTVQANQARVERLTQDKDKLEQEEAERSARGDALRRELTRVEQDIRQTQEEYRTLTERIRERQAELESARRELRQEEQRRDAVRSRLDVVKEMQAEFAGFQQGVKEILKAREKGFRGIHGAVAELVRVPEKYETAVEVALGGALQNVVVDDEKAGREAIGYLKRHNLGRATFLPLDVIRPRLLSAADRRALAKEAGVVGIASELVSFDEPYRAVVESLLGTVIVAETLEQANRVARMLGYRYRVVTLEGDIVNAGGSMTGGAVKKNSTNLLGRGRQAEELEGQLRRIEQAIHAGVKRVEALNAEIGTLTERQEALRAQGEALRLKEQELKGQLQQAEAEGKRLTEQLFVLTQDLDGYGQEITQAKEKLAACELRLAALAEREQALSAAVAAAEAKRQEQLANKEEMNERITSLKVLAAQAKQELVSREEQVERLMQERQDLSREWEDANRFLAALDEQEASLDMELAAVEAQLAELRGQKDRVAAQIQERRGERATLSARLEQAEGEARAIRKQAKDAEERLHQEEVKANRYDVELDHLLAKLAEEYELTYEAAREKYPPREDAAAAQREVNRLKKEIAALGTVNLGAIEEHERLSERLGFLKTQEADLNAAKAQLYQVINEMDQEMARRFAQTFEEIRAQFGVVFAQLFGGGRADLLLSQPDNLLETGIDIVAQPPGKKLQNLALLSGGERALTAMALLFAILRVKPVPFCVLDEVEAALDEANVSRFAEYMREFSQKTQFICVTHRKGTMESADVLYGITMQEDGVSKIVSVRLEETSKLAGTAS